VPVLVDVALNDALVEWLAVGVLVAVVDAAFAKVERDAGGGALKNSLPMGASQDG